MMFPALGAVTAMWLLICPLLDVEAGYRAALAVSVGLAALILAPIGMRYRLARVALTPLGGLLALVSFIDPPAIGALANFVACAAVLAVAGMAPLPVVETVRRAVAAAPLREAAAPVENEQPEADTRRLAAAA